jgi:SAM-dependent methyltransferase
MREVASIMRTERLQATPDHTGSALATEFAPAPGACAAAAAATTPAASAAATSAYYEAYYRRRGADRNHLANPEVLFQTLALEASVIRALGSLPIDPTTSRVLDVGCGDGANLFPLLRMQFPPEKIVGVDLIPERIARARRLHPGIDWRQADARQLPFANASFDVVFESTMFTTIVDDSTARAIAEEMQRACRSGGWIVLVDWWMPKPGDTTVKALTYQRLNRLFDLRSTLKLQKRFAGALAPPLGRFLSRWCPAAYFAVASVFPFTIAQGVYLLQKN